jgi:hypothetical protein
MVDVDFPSSGYATEILIVDQGGNLDAYAYPLDGTPIATTIAPHTGADVSLEALLYQRTPRELLLDVGKGRSHLVLVPSGTDTEAFPPPDGVYTMSIAGGSAGTWAKQPGPSARAAQLRIQRRNRLLCSAGDMCFTDDPAGADPHCTSPCPDLHPPDMPTPTQNWANPILEPCPEGWIADGNRIAGLTVCRPPDPVSCPPGQYQLEGASACSPLGDPCAPGTWPAGLPAGTLYVKSGALAGGTGTQAAPFAAISDAITAAAGSATIAVARGTYAERIVLAKSVTILGACTAEISLGGAGATPEIMVQSGAPTIADLTVRGGIQAGIGARLTLRGVLVDGTGQPSAAIVDGTLGVAGSVLANAAVGISVRSGGSLDLEHSLVDRNLRVGIEATSAAVVLSHFIVHQNGGQDSTSAGMFLSDSSLIASSGIFDSNVQSALEIAGTRSNATLAQLIFENTTPLAMPMGTQAVFVRDGAQATLDRLFFDSNFDGAIRALTGATVSTTDTIVRDVPVLGMSDPCGTGFAATDARLSSTNTFMAGVHREGIGVDGASSADIYNLIVADNRSGCESGSGVHAGGTSRLRLRKAFFLRLWGRGVRIEDSGGPSSAVVNLEDVTYDGAESCPPSCRGEGILISTTASATVERAQVKGSNDFALRVSGHALAVLRDVEVSRTFSDGLYFAEDASVSVDRAHLSGIGRSGIFALRSTSTLRSISIDTSTTGIEVGAGASISLSDFDLKGNVTGIVIDDATQRIGIQGGRVDANTTGARYPTSFDANTLLHRVVYQNVNDFTTH